MKQISKLLLAAALLAGTVLQVQADDKKVDPTGTYTWTMPGRNGGPDRTNTLTLKLDGDKLTGKLTAPARGGKTSDTDIANGAFTNSTVSFTVVRTYNDNSFTNSYSGTVSADTITGKVEFNRNGDVQSRDWTAKLQK